MISFFTKITNCFKPKKLKPLKPAKLKSPKPFNSRHYRQLIGKLAGQAIATQHQRARREKHE